MRKQLTNPIYFQVVMVIITMLTSCAFLRVRLGSISLIGLAIGALLCVCTLFDGTLKKVFGEKQNFLIVAFCCSYLISIALNRDSELVTNIKQWIYMVLFLYVFCLVTGIRSREDRKKDLRIVSYVYCILTFIVALVSFYMFLIEFSYHAQDPATNLWYSMGMKGTRLAGLYNSNTSASIFTTSIVTSLFLFFDVKNRKNVKVKRIFTMANIVSQFCCLVLTCSRGAIYSFYFAVLVASSLLLRKRFEKDNSEKKWIKIITISIIIVVLVFGTDKIVRLGLEYVPGLISNSKIETSFVASPQLMQVDKVELNREYSSVTSGRAELWIASLDIIKDYPLFGIPYESLSDKASVYLENKGVGTDYLNAGGTFHNIILSCLVCSGIIGFIPMAAFIILKLIDSLKFAFKVEKYELIELLPLVVVLMALVNEMVESRILYSVNILNVMFWIEMGYLPSFKKVTNET